MKLLKQFFDFYINSSIHVSLAVFSLAWMTLLEYKIPYDASILYFIFFASISGYNFVKYFGMAKFYHRTLAGWLKGIQLFSFCCFLFMCYYILEIRKGAFLGILIFGAITFFYAMPLLPKAFFKNQQNLRNIGGIKVYLIALVWTGVTVMLPLINNNYPFKLEVLLTCVQRFIYVVVLMIPFEIRDLRYDSIKLATIPQKMGVIWTKILGVVLSLIFILIEFFKMNTSQSQITVMVIVTLLTVLFVVGSKQDQEKYYSSFYVEGLPILWLVLALLIR